ncbi:hypothetical protein [Spiroplasma endosymbiont of Panorpa germanica]|uniref:hypothetical protein n=1 Tax=Spiroplasma endosymbiont of Panorpa germanica TaxID=3066314 RepID=UPI0030D35662
MIEQSKIAHLSEFLNNLEDRDMDFIFDEITSAINLILAYEFFIDKALKFLQIHDDKPEKLTLVKDDLLGLPITAMQIYKFVFNNLEKPTNVLDFSNKAINSLWFNPNYPTIVIDYLNKNHILEDDLSQLLIISQKDEFISYFVNKIDIDGWKREMIDIVVENID